MSHKASGLSGLEPDVALLSEAPDSSDAVAVVTGGSRGLGLETAVALGQSGAKVAILARRERWLQQAVAELAAAGITACSYTVDMAAPERVADVVSDVEMRWGRIDTLVNCAGVAWAEPAIDASIEKFDEVVRVNLVGAFVASQAVARGMMRRKRGTIINVASVLGLRGAPAGVLDTISYASSKAGLVGMTRDLAAKWGPFGIRVNAVAPGFFRTRMTEDVLKRVEDRLAERIPLGRVGQPGEVGGVVAFLASDAAAYVTGQVLCIDGGMTSSI